MIAKIILLSIPVIIGLLAIIIIFVIIKDLKTGKSSLGKGTVRHYYKGEGKGFNRAILLKIILVIVLLAGAFYFYDLYNGLTG